MPSPRSQYPMCLTRSTRLFLLLALAVPLALGACAGGDTPLEPADAPSAGEPPSRTLPWWLRLQRILFSSSRKGGYDLFKMDPQGYNVVRVTSFANYETEPAWSKDNKRIAMTRPRPDASNVQHSDIYLMNADGTNKRWARSVPSLVRHSLSLLVALTVLATRGERHAGGGKSYLATLKLATGAMGLRHAGRQGPGGLLSPSFDPTGKHIVYVGASGKTITKLYSHRLGNTGCILFIRRRHS